MSQVHPISLRLPALRKHQVKVWQSPARHKLLIKGRRWGGTVLGIVSALIGPSPKARGVLSGANVLWVDLSFPVASSVWRTFRSTLEPAALEVNAAERTIIMPGSGQITVKSAERPESLIGSIRAVDLVILNEVSKHDPMVWAKSIRPVLVDSHGASLWITTPERTTNWVEQVYAAAEHLPDWERWRLPSTDNEFFDPAEIDRAIAEGMPPAIADCEFMCVPLSSTSGLAFNEFSPPAHVREVNVDPSLPLSLCASWKGSPPAFFVVQGDATHENVLEEITCASGSVRDLAAEFKRRYPSYATGHRVTIYGDATPLHGGRASTGSSDFEPLRSLLPRAQHRVRFASIDPKDSVNVLNAILREPGFVSIDPKCARLRRDLETLENKPATFAIDASPGNGHFAFAWAMRQHWLHPFGNPMFKKEGQTA